MELPLFPTDPTCSLCTLHVNATNICSPTIFYTDSTPSSPTAFIFIGQNPGYQEDRSNAPFIGPSGQYVKKILCSASIAEGTPALRHLTSIYFTNTARCTSPPEAPPKSRDYITCSTNYLYKDLDAIRAAHTRTILFCLGRPASAYTWKYLTGKKGKDSVASYTKLNGSTFDDVSFVGTYHPAAFLRENSYHESIINHLRVAIDIVLYRRPSVTKPDIVPPFSPETT